ncbi:hypothetical protein T265_04819 [Opisthorchis viverrini]|uniref:Uncharacterized protein n=1 Tax=Opisthorchis viverrini TaxID=6198 RepID=A0A074ZLW8_OPIVI|nr:hypothetical protein T265_04819 [Opisthorchis viverrini]KER28363.1 hypothetical protein T265_04819 [Opisthorchis viverrini]
MSPQTSQPAITVQIRKSISWSLYVCMFLTVQDLILVIVMDTLNRAIYSSVAPFTERDPNQRQLARKQHGEFGIPSPRSIISIRLKAFVEELLLDNVIDDLQLAGFPGSQPSNLGPVNRSAVNRLGCTASELIQQQTSEDFLSTRTLICVSITETAPSDW